MRDTTHEVRDHRELLKQVARRAAAALLLESQAGQLFDAIVTGASKKGTRVRVFTPPVRWRLERGFIDFVRG